ncbi:MAG: D-amino acid aminotransferase [Bacteroidia bacterium]
MQQYNPRNADIWVYVKDRLWPRAEARVSVFDSAVQGGDAVWEGLRVYQGRVFCLDKHLARLQASAKALAFADIPDADSIRQVIFETLRANGMYDGAHIRLTLTRGEKITSGMDPRLNQSGPTLIVLAEWKAPIFGGQGLRLITSSIRRNSPHCLDSKIHHNNLLNNILAKIEANFAGVDEALMLDLDGFVAETNSTNVFLVRGETLHTPLPDACLPGITRGLVIDLARAHGIALAERRISVSEFHTADEVFTTGTMGELIHVTEIDGRGIGDGGPGPLTRRLQALFNEKTAREGEPF